MTIDVNAPPDCSTVVVSPDVLWPPNHKLFVVTISGATDPDGDPPTYEATGLPPKTSDLERVRLAGGVCAMNKGCSK